MNESVIMAGFGGQGILLMGQLLCYAGMHEGLKVTWMPSYGPEMRGGTANCTVMLSSERIGSPITRFPSSLVAMNRASLVKFEPTLLKDGLLVINSSLVEQASREDVRIVKVAANRIAEQAGTLQVANMAALGAYVGGKGIVPLEAVVIALKRMIPEHRKELLAVNEAALRRGFETGKSFTTETQRSQRNGES